MNKRLHPILVSSIGLVYLVLATGCAGPKLMSTKTGSHKALGSITPNQEVSIRGLHTAPPAASSDDDYGEQLLYINHLMDNLAEKLRTNSQFSGVTIVAEADNVATPYMLEVKVVGVNKRGWASRATGFGGDTQSKASVAGRLVDVAHDQVVLTFEKSRSSQGGLLGMGGWLSAGEEAIAKKHMEWLADDIVAAIHALAATKTSQGDGS